MSRDAQYSVVYFNQKVEKFSSVEKCLISENILKEIHGVIKRNKFICTDLEKHSLYLNQKHIARSFYLGENNKNVYFYKHKISLGLTYTL